MEEQDYLKSLDKMSNHKLLDELVSLNAYSPEDTTPEEIIQGMIKAVKRAIISRMKPHIMATELHRAIMNRDDVSLEDADELVQELKESVREGGDAEQLLFDEGFEPDYVFDIIDL